MLHQILKPYLQTYNDKLLAALMINWTILFKYHEYTFPYNLYTTDNQTILIISVYYNAVIYIESSLQELKNMINIFMCKEIIYNIKIQTKLALFSV